MYTHKSGIKLRKADLTDLPDLLALKAESWWGTHRVVIANAHDQRKWFESLPADQLVMIAKHVTDANIGVAIYSDIDHLSRTLKISGSVYKAHRQSDIVKSGFAAGLDFAFEVLNMHRVEAEVLEYHIPGQRLEIDYLGFKVEGRRRQAVYKCGRHYDSLVLGMLRDEWAGCERVKGYGDSCNEEFSPDRFQRLADRWPQPK
jgi:RimJ/RimL family protein N-acetyltransferase